MKKKIIMLIISVVIMIFIGIISYVFIMDKAIKDVDIYKKEDTVLFDDLPKDPNMK